MHTQTHTNKCTQKHITRDTQTIILTNKQRNTPTSKKRTNTYVDTQIHWHQCTITNTQILTWTQIQTDIYTHRYTHINKQTQTYTHTPKKKKEKCNIKRQTQMYYKRTKIHKDIKYHLSRHTEMQTAKAQRQTHTYVKKPKNSLSWGHKPTLTTHWSK